MQAVVSGMTFIAGVMTELSHTDDKGQEKWGRTGHNYWLTDCFRIIAGETIEE